MKTLLMSLTLLLALSACGSNPSSSFDEADTSYTDTDFTDTWSATDATTDTTHEVGIDTVNDVAIADTSTTDTRIGSDTTTDTTTDRVNDVTPELVRYPAPCSIQRIAPEEFDGRSPEIIHYTWDEFGRKTSATTYYYVEDIETNTIDTYEAWRYEDDRIVEHLRRTGSNPYQYRTEFNWIDLAGNWYVETSLTWLVEVETGAEQIWSAQFHNYEMVETDGSHYQVHVDSCSADFNEHPPTELELRCGHPGAYGEHSMVTEYSEDGQIQQRWQPFISGDGEPMYVETYTHYDDGSFTIRADYSSGGFVRDYRLVRGYADNTDPNIVSRPNVTMVRDVVLPDQLIRELGLNEDGTVSWQNDYMDGEVYRHYEYSYDVAGNLTFATLAASDLPGFRWEFGYDNCWDDIVLPLPESGWDD
jgi:hypothetical protein